MIENLDYIIIMEIDINKIKEIHRGHFCMLLDFPTLDLLRYILDESYKYVWVVNYNMQSCEWSEDSYHLLDDSIKNVQIRNMNLDFLMNTSDFVKWIPSIKSNLHILQVNKIPPYYLDMKKLTGKTKYDLLKKDADYLFEINLSSSFVSSDYTEIISPNLSFLKELLRKTNKNISFKMVDSTFK